MNQQMGVEKVNKDSLGGPMIVAALMLAVSILGGSYFLSQSLQRGSESLNQLAAAVGEMKLGAVAQAAAPAAKAARTARPDPNKRYSVALRDAPIKGSAGAAISIVEWSDFQ